MSMTRLIMVLAVIAILAIAFPYAAVRSLHQHRLTSVDAELQRLATPAGRAIDTAPRVNVLLGPGRVPRTTDLRWNSGSTYPLQPALGDVAVTADPWGNAFVVNVGVRHTPSAIWLLSAGPDGTLQTSFDGSSDSPAGDDLGRRLR